LAGEQYSFAGGFCFVAATTARARIAVILSDFQYVAARHEVF
jgi:hypothetical protein